MKKLSELEPVKLPFVPALARVHLECATCGFRIDGHGEAHARQGWQVHFNYAHSGQPREVRE